jgi:hypothetical protein
MKKTTKNQEHLADYFHRKLHYVYYLPEEHYVGVTSQKYPCARINKHNFLGFNTDNWYILNVFETREEARHLENMFHSYMGCNGVNLNS